MIKRKCVDPYDDYELRNLRNESKNDFAGTVPCVLRMILQGSIIFLQKGLGCLHIFNLTRNIFI